MPAALRRPGESNVCSRAAGRGQCPQPCGREETVPAAMRRPGPGGRSARGPEAAGRKQHPQPGGREQSIRSNELGGTAPAARRPGGDSARSSARRTHAEAEMFRWMTWKESGGCRRPSRVRPSRAGVWLGGSGGHPHPQRVGPRRVSCGWSGFETARKTRSDVEGRREVGVEGRATVPRPGSRRQEVWPGANRSGSGGEDTGGGCHGPVLEQEEGALCQIRRGWARGRDGVTTNVACRPAGWSSRVGRGVQVKGVGPGWGRCGRGYGTGVDPEGGRGGCGEGKIRCGGGSRVSAGRGCR